jgi:hypothetical protein
MIGLNAILRSAFLFSLLVFLASATCILPSFGEGRIYIGGITPSSAYPNDAVRVYGDGATPNGIVAAMLGGPVNGTFIVGNGTGQWINVGSSNLTLGWTSVGGSGDWQINFLTPNVLSGYYNVYVFDNESLTSDAISFQVLMNATIEPIWGSNMTIWFSNMTGLTLGQLLFFVSASAVPSSGPVGTFVTLQGHSASGGEISIYFDGSRVATVVGQLGDWSVSFQVPNVAVGNHTISAIDAGGEWMSSTSFYVTSPVISYSMSLSPLLYLFGFSAIILLSAATLFILLAMFYRKKKQQNKSLRKHVQDS